MLRPGPHSSRKLSFRMGLGLGLGALFVLSLMSRSSSPAPAVPPAPPAVDGNAEGIFGVPLFRRGMAADKLDFTAGTDAPALPREGDAVTPSELLERAQSAEGLRAAYPTYELKAAGTAPNAADEVDEITAEVDMLDLVDKSEATAAGSAGENEDETSAPSVEETDGEAESGVEGASGAATDSQTLLKDEIKYNVAPTITVPVKKYMKQGLWWGLKAYEKYYKANPVKWYVPRVQPGIQLSFEDFYDRFRRHGRPVIMKFENLRSLGFKMQSYSIEQLRAMFPFDSSKLQDQKVFEQYEANKKIKDPNANLIDLGPGIASIALDGELRKIKSSKTGKKNVRSFPRNMQVRPKDVERLGVEPPPLLHDNTLFQQATVWMGTSTSDTRFHHDCCDNFVEMVSGTKRFTLAPPTDWRTLSPVCVGKNKGLCWANVAHPNAPNPPARVAKIMSKVHKVVVDIGPGEILYMPAGWFHHVENLGPTVMVNYWTKKNEQIGLLRALKRAAGIADDPDGASS